MKIVYLIVPVLILVSPVRINAQTATSSNNVSSPSSATPSAADQQPLVTTQPRILLEDVPSPSPTPISSDDSLISMRASTMRNIIAFTSIVLLIIIAFSAGKLSAKQESRD